ncbi:hypothetical protein B0J12DRAFT_744855 [Macrophomina phaseolina]|uniref:Uncharacterized protein n=1 Tax=Macrophomina phaseolina TaxID=35725 RepID=A0ABQ8FWY4_9PEZI|nr:hypothetical protein B0J12DRAFT_744855 [Macrophomina phaseolina]
MPTLAVTYLAHTVATYSVLTIGLPSRGKIASLRGQSATLDNRASVIEVKGPVETRTTNELQLRFQGSVFSGNCSNWYIGDFGRNVASWPGLAIGYWFATLFPDWKAFEMKGGSRVWHLNALARWMRRRQKLCIAGVLGAAALGGSKTPRFLVNLLQDVVRRYVAKT